MRRLFGFPQARRYLVGQSVSLFGDMTLWLAMGIWVKTLTGSDGAAGLTFFFFALPQLFAPLSGVIVDRLPRRTLLVWTNLATAVLVLTLFAVRGPGQVWLIYLVMFGYGASYTILGPGGAALMRMLLPDELLADANGYLRTIQEGLRLVGPITGAALFTLFGGGVLALIDAASFVVAATALWSVQVSEVPPSRRDEPWLANALAGLRHLRRTPVLRQLTAAAAVALLVIGMIESVAFAVVAQGLHRPVTFLGTLVAIQGGGAIVGGFSAGPAIRRVREGFVVAGGLLAFAAGAALFAVPNLLIVSVGAVLIGFSLTWVVIGYNTALQHHSPLALQGRVSAGADLLVGTPQTFSIAVGAALVSVVDFKYLLFVIAVVVAGCSAYLLTRPQQRASSQAMSSR